MPLRATMGGTQNDMAHARPGVVDRGQALQVTLTSGVLENVDEADLVGGANLAAIGDGSADRWEGFQFARA